MFLSVCCKDRECQSGKGSLGLATTRIAAVLLAGSMMSGCAYLKRDHVEVGAVPDDYRTNHPIVITEREEVIDVPIGVTDQRLTRTHKAAVLGFLDRYDAATGATVQVMMPTGSANERAVANLSGELFGLIVHAGVPRHRIVALPYQASAAETAAPIRLTYNTMAASAGQCGRWPEDILKASSENKHYSNFGCSYQNNLAAQVANPADLLGPRKPSEIDAERRVLAIDGYREDNLNVRQETNFDNP